MTTKSVIDLRSDTVTKPSDDMRRAMAESVVGDDILDGDPTTRQLEETVAELCGKEAALFFPSGTQTNQTAIWLHTQRGTELILEAEAHLVHYEKAGIAGLSGVQIRPVATPDGVLTADLIAPMLRHGEHEPEVSALAVENTHNRAGGKVMPLSVWDELVDFAARLGLPIHLDGARLWNAAVALGETLARVAQGATSVSVCLSKGLGCPVGSCLAGDAATINRAKAVRRRFGGAMRQSGILAAAGLYALENNLPGLADDHANATLFAQRLVGHPKLQPTMPDTNIVMVDLMEPGLTAEAALTKLAEAGVLLVPFGPTRLRAVTHLDVSKDEVQHAAEVSPKSWASKEDLVRVIVAGAGEVGFHVAERLSKEGQDVVVVDVRPERLDYVQAHLDVAVVEGSGASISVLEHAGIRKAGLLTAVTNVDEANLVSCMSVRGVKDLVRVARVSNPDFYSDGAHLNPEVFGVDVMINPERELALETTRLLKATAATDVATFAGGAVQLVGLRVTDDAPVAGRTLAEIGSEYKGGSMLTVALTRDGTTIVPTGGTEIQGGDLVYYVVTDKMVPQGLELCGYHQSEVRRVMIAGGSLEAYYLAGFLNQHRAQVIMLVKEKERARELAEKLNHALILNGDATDVELLEMEGVAGVDGFVALTDHDERNILAAVLAQHAGAKQVITLVNKTDYVPLAKRIGLDAVVSPRLSAANAILRYVRRGTVTSVATFKDSDAEAISFHVSSTSPLVGRRLSDIEFPDGAIVAAIVRSSVADPIIPGGDDKLAAGDSVIVFALPAAVGPVTDLFPS